VVYCGVLKSTYIGKFLRKSRAATFSCFFFFHTRNTLNRGEWCTVGKGSGVLRCTVRCTVGPEGVAAGKDSG
jgi:hypothetical protein